MLTKLGCLFDSLRFWIVVLTAALAILNGQPVIETIQIALAAVVGIGTLDSVATKVGGA